MLSTSTRKRTDRARMPIAGHPPYISEPYISEHSGPAALAKRTGEPWWFHEDEHALPSGSSDS
jgi:hypothetical protein